MTIVQHRFQELNVLLVRIFKFPFAFLLHIDIVVLHVSNYKRVK